MPKPTIGFKSPEAEIIERLQSENAELKQENSRLKDMIFCLQKTITDLEAEKEKQKSRSAVTLVSSGRRLRRSDLAGL